VRREDTAYERKWLPERGDFEKNFQIQSGKRLLGTLLDTTQPIIRDRVVRVGLEKVEGFESLMHDLCASWIRTRKLEVRKLPGIKIRGEWSEPALVAVWTLCQADSPRARELVRLALSHEDERVVVAAIHSAGLWRDRDAVAKLNTLLKSESLHIRRAAAESLGLVGADMAVASLVKSLSEETNDRVLDHALTYALIELDNRFFLTDTLGSPHPQVRRAALTALDQLGEKLDPKVVLAAMKSSDLALKETAQWIAGRHPEWADQLAGVFREQLAAAKPADRDALVAQLARLAKTAGIQKLLAGTVADPKASDAARVTALKAMAQAGLRPPPGTWYSALEEPLVPATSKDVALAALATLRALPPQKKRSETLPQRLKALWTSAGSSEVGLNAMAAFPGRITDLSPHEIDLLRGGLHPDLSAPIRGLTADVLAKTNLEPSQLEAVIRQLPEISPLDLDRVLGIFAQTREVPIGVKLIAALNNPSVRPALRVDSVKERIKHFPPAVHKAAEKLYVALNADYEHQRAKLEELSKTLPAGDVRRGQAVFNSTKTSCIACHTVGYVGGKQGPDLTRIGGIRTERDLLESILFPSASFVRSYEPVIVTTKAGQSFNGVPKKDAPDEMILVLAADKEARIPRDDVEEVRPGKVSIMPDGLDRQLTPQELADLIAFLKNCK
jgi:putative heme-binding domain-containing protein